MIAGIIKTIQNQFVPMFELSSQERKRLVEAIRWMYNKDKSYNDGQKWEIKHLGNKWTQSKEIESLKWRVRNKKTEQMFEVIQKKAKDGFGFEWSVERK